MNPNKFISLAKEVAFTQMQLTEYNQNSYHVSIITYGKSFEIGVNSYHKSHPKFDYGNGKYYLHSEADAFIKLQNVTDKSKTLINFRFNKYGKLLLAKPCKNCLTWCVEEFDKIYYSNNCGFIERLY